MSVFLCNHLKTGSIIKVKIIFCVLIGNIRHFTAQTKRTKGVFIMNIKTQEKLLFSARELTVLKSLLKLGFNKELLQLKTVAKIS